MLLTVQSLAVRQAEFLPHPRSPDADLVCECVPTLLEPLQARLTQLERDPIKGTHCGDAWSMNPISEEVLAADLHRYRQSRRSWTLFLVGEAYRSRSLGGKLASYADAPGVLLPIPVVRVYGAGGPEDCGRSPGVPARSWKRQSTWNDGALFGWDDPM